MTKAARAQLELPEATLQRLGELKNKTEARSYADVVKNALRLYEALIEEVEAGGSFLVRDSTGHIREYDIF